MILSPGATIGILGAGQLGRMLAMGAVKVGLRTHIFAPEDAAPAYDAAAARTVAAFEDEAALARFAEAVDVVTFEWENVPTTTVEFLAERLPVRPGARALALTQDRLTEKTFVRDLGPKVRPYVGVLAVEMFVTRDHHGHEALIVNEIAPRVHNSGHWTLEGAQTSQFEQHIRAIAGWPLGSTTRRGRAEMHNLIGEDAEDWRDILAQPDLALHLYGKLEIRPGP